MPAPRVAVATVLTVSLLAVAACTASTTGGHGTALHPPPTSSSTSAPVPAPASGELTDCLPHPTTCNSAAGGDVAKGGDVTVGISPLQGWNEYDNLNYSTGLGLVLNGVLPNVFIAQPNYDPVLNTDIVSSATSTTSGPQVITYTINPSATWNDATPIGVDDFTYTWHAAAAADIAGYDAIGSVVAGAGHTVVVHLTRRLADWAALFSPLYPGRIAAVHGSITAAGTWFSTHVPDYSAGPYEIASGSDLDSVRLERNPRWGGTPGTLDSISFKAYNGPDELVTALRDGEVQVIQPTVSSETVAALKAMSGISYELGPGASWEHLNLGTKNPTLRDQTLREAIFTTIDSSQITTAAAQSLGADVEPVYNHMLLPGQAGNVDNISRLGQGSGDVDKAKRLLRAAGYHGVGTVLRAPSGSPVRLSCGYSNPLRAVECAAVEAQLRPLGLTVTPKQTDIAVYLKGRYDLLIFAWLGGAFPTYGGASIYSSYAGTHHAEVQALLSQAASATSPGASQRLLNRADAVLSADAYELPLYRKPSVLAFRSDLVNVRDNTSSYGPTYNIAQWGLRA